MSNNKSLYSHSLLHLSIQTPKPITKFYFTSCNKSFKSDGTGDIVDIYTNYTKLYKLLQPKLSNFDDSVNKFTMVYDNIIEQLTTNWDAVNVVFSGLIGTKLLISRGILYPLSPGASL